MEKMFCVFWGFFLVLGLQLAEGCLCGARLHPQQHFCGSSFAIKTTILSRKVIGSMFTGDLLYEARIDEIFKMENDNITEGKTVTIETATSGAICGMSHLQNDTAYVLTGSVSRDMVLYIDLCGSFVSPWDFVTASQREAFRSSYQLSCTECKLTTSIYSTTSQQCGFRYSGYGDCEFNYSTCMQGRKGSCEWLSTPAYEDCISKRDGTTEDSGSGFLPSW